MNQWMHKEFDIQEALHLDFVMDSMTQHITVPVFFFAWPPMTVVHCVLEHRKVRKHSIRYSISKEWYKLELSFTYKLQLYDIYAQCNFILCSSCNAHMFIW